MTNDLLDFSHNQGGRARDIKAHKVFAIDDPVTDTEAANKKYVDAKVTETLTGDVNVVKVSMLTAGILTANGTPLTIIAAPGSGKFLDILPITVISTFNSVAYTTNV